MRRRRRRGRRGREEKGCFDAGGARKERWEGSALAFRMITVLIVAVVWVPFIPLPQLCGSRLDSRAQASREKEGEKERE